MISFFFFGDSPGFQLCLGVSHDPYFRWPSVAGKVRRTRRAVARARARASA
jgi:hypothetical protein